MSQILPLIRRIAENSRARNGDGRMEKFFLFRFAAKSFVVPAVDVTEVVMPGPLISVPQQSDLLMGVVNVRGTVVPVINVRHRIGLEKNYETTDDSRLMIFTVKPGVYMAVVADDIEYRLKEGVLAPIPPELAESGEKSFRSALVDDKQIHVFLVDQWLDAGEIEILQKVVESF
jgi:purine-binding chemotaxis protein CheW